MLVSKLRDPLKFDLYNEISILLKTFLKIFNFDFKIFKQNVKKTLTQLNKIMKHKKLEIEKYQRFTNIEGIPLNSTPWGTITSIDIIKKKIGKFRMVHILN